MASQDTKVTGGEESSESACLEREWGRTEIGNFCLFLSGYVLLPWLVGRNSLYYSTGTDTGLKQGMEIKGRQFKDRFLGFRWLWRVTLAG